MKILSIRIKNLASLEGITEIDFTKPPLSTAGIFAITGPTGAGKSTILDALCLALYGKTPRYLEAKEQGIEVRDGKTGFINQGDCRGILRDGTGEGYAQVDFQGVDGNSYTATWRVRRARDKAEGLMQGDSMELKNRYSGIPFPGKKKEVTEETERLVGLNLEQFTRSVLLAQGDFTAFLKSAKDDKSALLEKLTGTQIYSEISQRIYENHRTEAELLRDLNTRREGILTITIDELAALREKNKVAKLVIENKQAEMQALDKELNWYLQFTSLGHQLELADKLIADAEETKQKAAGRLVRLTQVEFVQPARKFLDDQSTLANQLAAKNEILSELEKASSLLVGQASSSASSLETATEAWKNNREKYSLAKPLITEALELDVKVAGKLEQVNDAKIAAVNAADKLLQKQKAIEVTMEKNSTLQTSVKELQEWKEQNQSSQPIAEQESLILSKLKDAKQLVLDSARFVNEISEMTAGISKETKSFEKLNAACIPLELELKEGKDSYILVTSKLSEIEITEIENSKVSIDHKLSDLAIAASHWENLFERNSNLIQSTKKLNDGKADYAEKVLQLEKSVEVLNTARIQKETSLEQFQKASLAITENVESLRAQLNPGEACPVCGSPEHPYSDHNPQLDIVMQQLEATYLKFEKMYGEALSLNSALKENVLMLATAIESGAVELAEKESQLESLHKKWKKFLVHKDIEHIPDNEKAVWLAEEIAQTTLLQTSLQEKLTSNSAQRKEQESLQNHIKVVEQQVNANREATNKSSQARELLEQKLSHSTKENNKLNVSLQQIKKSQDVNFANADWFEHWQKEPSLFEENIVKFSSEWNYQTQKLIEDSATLQTIGATLMEQESQLQSLLTEQEAKEIVFTGLKQQYDNLLQQRNLIFDGAAASEVESALREAVEKGLEHLKQQEQVDSNLKTALAKIGAQVEQVQKDVLHMQEEEIKGSRKIEGWLTNFNKQHSLCFDIANLEATLQYTPEWILEERNALRGMDDAVTQARSVLQERTSQLKQHQTLRLSDRPVSELQLKLEKSHAEFDLATREKNETALLLQQDEENKRKIGDLLITINDQAIITDNWAKLNEIIGSADGKKFRQMAQEYTLDVLLGYANIHLQSLSQRYLLERISNTLGLQVLDLDMGNEVRTVFSLSGGESFLVSLALALGLASLSSSRMKVESLFIDEGFGSLDPATLNIAMDALERLHNQGRKVGVISHVQEMTERISTQVKVSKLSNGRSKVEVIVI